MNRDRHTLPGFDAGSAFEDESAFPELGDRFEQLSAYLDGELSEAERATVEQMLASDIEVQAQYRQLARLQSSFSHLSVPAAARNNGDATAERVLERLQQPRWLPAPLMQGHKFYRHYAPIAAGLLAAFTGWTAWEVLHSPQPLVSLETAPVVIPTLVVNSPATRQAGSYLLAPTSDRDAYQILFDEKEDDASPNVLWQ